MMADSRATNDAMISVIEKARGRQDSVPSERLLSVALMGVYFIVLMWGLAMGATMLRAAVEAQSHANQLHLQSGLVTGVVHGGDFADAVSLGDGPEGDSLVLSRTIGERTYETRIYQYDGSVMEEFTVAGNPYNPTSATQLMPSSTFDLRLEGSLVTFTTDEGSFCVALRSAQDQGGAS